MPIITVVGNTITISGTGITAVVITTLPSGPVVVNDTANNSPYTLPNGKYRVAVTWDKGTETVDVTLPSSPTPSPKGV